MAALTLAEADQIIAGACAKMEEIGVKLTISVVDGRGDLIALARVDGASWRTPYISQGKAVASATWGLSTRRHGSPLDRADIPRVHGLQGGRFIPSQGALPHLQGRRARRRGRRQRRHSPGGRRLRSRRHRVSRPRNRRITSIMRRATTYGRPCLILSFYFTPASPVISHRQPRTHAPPAHARPPAAAPRLHPLNPAPHRSPVRPCSPTPILH